MATSTPMPMPMPMPVAPPSPPTSTRCDCCESCGALLELQGCGHRFHPRCIYTFPIDHCEICGAAATSVRLLPSNVRTPVSTSASATSKTNQMTRKGKWSPDEHKYANLMMKQFQVGALPLLDGLHLRGFIANLLQCDPLRVTKKYAGHAIGKQNFYYQRRKAYCYNLHTKLQKRIANLRNHFYWHLEYRGRPAGQSVQALKAAEAEYWRREFIKFAERIGQSLDVDTTVNVNVNGGMAAPSLTTVAVPMPVPVPMPKAAVEQVQNQEQAHQDQDPDQDQSQRHEQEDQDMLKMVESEARGGKMSDNDDGMESRSESPVSFDEWPDKRCDRNQVLVELLDPTAAVIDDLTSYPAQQVSQLLHEIVAPVTDAAMESTPDPSLPSGFRLPSLTAQVAMPSITRPTPSAASSVPSSSLHSSLREWLNEEEARWNEAVTPASWSFSLGLSETTEASLSQTIY